MRSSQVRLFDEPAILASTLLAGGTEYLDTNEQGLLVIPNGVELKGFHLVVALQKGSRTFVVQKVVGTEGGAYNSKALSELQNFAKGFMATIMHDPIMVIREGTPTRVRTGWHQNQASNRVDCWHLSANGELDLFQVGVFTHDNGRTWKLHGEYRWRGWLRQDKATGNLVGIPESPKWGSLDGGSSNRCQIFRHPEFIALLQTAEISEWDGLNREIEPPLPEVPGPGFAVVQWYIVFAGQLGQGPADLHQDDGNTAWIHGDQIVGVEPDPDGEIRLWRGDIVSYSAKVENWGAKKGGPPKLTGVKLVSRAW